MRTGHCEPFAGDILHGWANCSDAPRNLPIEIGRPSQEGGYAPRRNEIRLAPKWMKLPTSQIPSTVRWNNWSAEAGEVCFDYGPPEGKLMLRVPGSERLRVGKRRLGRLLVLIRKTGRAWQSPIAVAGFLALIAALLLYFLKRWYSDFSEVYRGVYVEAVGATMDIVIFGVVIALFDLFRRRSAEVARQMEIIDDFKKWNSEESRHRIAGAIRRLNRLGQTAIDFRGIEISNFSFVGNDIKSIAGSTFYDGTWGTMGRGDKVTLEKVDFGSLDCTGVTFSKFHPFPTPEFSLVFASFRDCNFVDANLSGACFRGASLEWTSEPPDEIGDVVDMGDGQVAFLQTYYPPFSGAELSGASFEDATFRNVDFRDAKELLDCNFRGARGLESCEFDNDEMKENVLREAEGRG